MRISLIVAVASLASAVPALAQPTAGSGLAGPPTSRSPGAQIERISDIITRDVQRGLISRADARSLRAEVASLRKMHHRYRNYEPRTREHSELMRRIDTVRALVLAAERQRFTRPGRLPRLSPADRDSPFEDVRRPSLVDPDRSLEQARRRSDRTYETGLYRDDVRDMNALRGPAPEKHEEGN